jgi:hypothetical protein
MNRRAAGTALWIAGLAAAGWLASHVDTGRYEGGWSRDAQARDRRNRGALGVLLGELRTSASDYLFIKTERYMHGGVAYFGPGATAAAKAQAPRAEWEEEHEDAAHGHAHGHDPAHGHEHEHDHEHEHEHEDGHTCQGMESVIPPSARDFRGWVGDLYRAVKPWRDPSMPHIHTDGQQLLPWYRLMTWSDPHYVQGYLAGSYTVQEHNRDQAMAFVEEGLAHNPEAFQLYVARGMLKTGNARRDGLDASGEDRRLLASAREDFRRALALGSAERPRSVGGEVAESAGWTVYEENDWQTARRMAELIGQKLGLADDDGVP